MGVKLMSRWLAVVAIFMACMVPAVASDHILEQAVYEDPTGKLGINEVVHERFTPIDTILARGYSSSVFWLRLTIQSAGQPLYLVVRPPFLDELVLFSPRADSPDSWSTQFGGDTLGALNVPPVHSSYLFEVKPDGKTFYYLRIKTTSTAMVHVQAMTLPEWLDQSMRSQISQFLFVGLMVAILIWATSDFIVRREALVGWFMLAQVMQILFSVSVTGYLGFFVPAWMNIDLMTSMIVQLTIGITMMFHRMLVLPFRPNVWAVRMLDLLIGLSLLATLLVLLGDQRMGLRLGAFNVLMFIPTLIWLGYTTKVDALPGRIALRIVYNALALVLAIVLMPMLGWGRSIDFYLNAITLQSLVSATIMGMFLYRRSSALERRSLEDQLKLEKVEQGLRDHRDKLDEQRRFIDMLSHELKTPISVAQITLDTVTLPDSKRARIERALRSMSDVIDRCRLSTQLDEKRMNIVKERFELSDLAEDVAASSLMPSRIELNLTPVLVDSDRQLLSVVLHNLIDNALKYSPADTRIRLDIDSSTSRFVRGVTLTVSNQYLGQQAPDCNAIFEKYVRGPTSTGMSGSGLGLHLCKQLVELLEGSITCQVLGNEVVFTLWLPENSASEIRSVDPADSSPDQTL